MLTPSLVSNDTPDTSSKQTTSYWATRPRLPVALLTNMLAIVALPPGHQVGIRRYLLKQMRLARPPWAEFNGVVVGHYEGHHPSEQDVLLSDV